MSLIVAVLLAAKFRGTQFTGWHWCGWALGGVLTIACVAWYRVVDQRRRQRPDYSRPPRSGQGVVAAAVLGVVAGLVHAYQVALWYVG
ncbi:hypothetical protein ACFQS1_25450 [Paractinoplanes rhizophilus]|uniref:Uncharacterized protein n=1 Tax=Paractinoplanes rhizophilus TaxID=1416877 RepID=A0ABW2HYZ7_9ACTN|nr:hypothetical protein [Actinoplanes sp.]